MLISFAFSPGIQHQKTTVNIWQKRSNLTEETWTTRVLSYISRNVLLPSKLQESLLLPFFVIHMGDVYLIYQEARPTDIIKITALPFWPKYVYDIEKAVHIWWDRYKKASYSLCSRLTTLWYHKWSELFVGKAMSKSMFHWGYLREWPTYVEQKRV